MERGVCRTEVDVFGELFLMFFGVSLSGIMMSYHLERVMPPEDGAAAGRPSNRDSNRKGES